MLTTDRKSGMSDAAELCRIAMITLIRQLDPKEAYRPSMISIWGQDFILNCREIYYFDYFSASNVLAQRQVWVPSLSPASFKDTPQGRERMSRARTCAARSRNNESWCKTEYSWEADAWNYAFGPLREDCCLAMYVTDADSKLVNVRLTLEQRQTKILRLCAEIRRAIMQAH